MHPGDAGDRRLDLAGDLLLELGGSRAEIGDDDRDDGRIDIGQQRDRQLPEADDAERKHDKREKDGR